MSLSGGAFSLPRNCAPTHQGCSGEMKQVLRNDPKERHVLV